MFYLVTMFKRRKGKIVGLKKVSNKITGILINYIGEFFRC